jgi:hypothetical protein
MHTAVFVSASLKTAEATAPLDVGTPVAELIANQIIHYVVVPQWTPAIQRLYRAQ